MKMKPLRIILLLGLGLCLPAWAAPAQPACGHPPDIRNLMSVREYTQSGLDKLSQKQLDALNAWLANYMHALCSPPPEPQQAPAEKTAPAGGNFGNPPPAHHEEVNTTDRIVSHIAGEFHGWTGQTKFQLTNGQVWIQAGPGYYETDMKSPKVVIKKLLIGYILQVNGNGKEVFVRRIH